MEYDIDLDFFAYQIPSKREEKSENDEEPKQIQVKTDETQVKSLEKLENPKEKSTKLRLLSIKEVKEANEERLTLINQYKYERALKRIEKRENKEELYYNIKTGRINNIKNIKNKKTNRNKVEIIYDDVLEQEILNLNESNNDDDVTKRGSYVYDEELMSMMKSNPSQSKVIMSRYQIKTRGDNPEFNKDIDTNNDKINRNHQNFNKKTRISNENLTFFNNIFKEKNKLLSKYLTLNQSSSSVIGSLQSKSKSEIISSLLNQQKEIKSMKDEYIMKISQVNDEKRKEKVYSYLYKRRENMESYIKILIYIKNEYERMIHIYSKEDLYEFVSIMKRKYYKDRNVFCFDSIYRRRVEYIKKIDFQRREYEYEYYQCYYYLEYYKVEVYDQYDRIYVKYL